MGTMLERHGQRQKALCCPLFSNPSAAPAALPHLLVAAAAARLLAAKAARACCHRDRQPLPPRLPVRRRCLRRWQECGACHAQRAHGCWILRPARLEAGATGGLVGRRVAGSLRRRGCEMLTQTRHEEWRSPLSVHTCGGRRQRRRRRRAGKWAWRASAWRVQHPLSTTLKCSGIVAAMVHHCLGTCPWCFPRSCLVQLLTAPAAGSCLTSGRRHLLNPAPQLHALTVCNLHVQVPVVPEQGLAQKPAAPGGQSRRRSCHAEEWRRACSAYNLTAPAAIWFSAVAALYSWCEPPGDVQQDVPQRRVCCRADDGPVALRGAGQVRGADLGSLACVRTLRRPSSGASRRASCRCNSRPCPPIRSAAPPDPWPPSPPQSPAAAS